MLLFVIGLSHALAQQSDEVAGWVATIDRIDCYASSLSLFINSCFKKCAVMTPSS